MINASLKTIGQSQCCHLYKKYLKKIVVDSVINFLEDNDILYNKQFGFRKRHSTTHAIITLTEKVTMALDAGKIVRGVFLDLKKAFDCVSHDILLNNLYNTDTDTENSLFRHN